MNIFINLSITAFPFSNWFNNTLKTQALFNNILKTQAQFNNTLKTQAQIYWKRWPCARPHSVIILKFTVWMYTMWNLDTLHSEIFRYKSENKASNKQSLLQGTGEWQKVSGEENSSNAVMNSETRG